MAKQFFIEILPFTLENINLHEDPQSSYYKFLIKDNIKFEKKKIQYFTFLITKIHKVIRELRIFMYLWKIEEYNGKLK